jgi:hypothetical protein
VKTGKTYFALALAVLLTGWASVMQAAAGKKEAPKTPAPETPLKSVFILPVNPSQGRDPFFPESTRVYDQLLAATHTNKVVELPPLTVPGISGTPGHFLAIINNHTFGEGDEGDVLTPSGKRVHVRCLKVEEDHVVVEVDGHNLTIKAGDQ